MSDCRTADTVKLTTNVFLDINIEFVNELTILIKNLGINSTESSKKYNFKPTIFGGGGGPCLPVNTYLLLDITSRLTDGDTTFGIICVGRRSNEHIPYVVIITCDGLVDFHIELTIAMLGIYRPNIRLSSKIINIQRSGGAYIRVYDLYHFGKTVFGICMEYSAIDAVRGADTAVLVTDHELGALDMRVIHEAGCSRLQGCNKPACGHICRTNVQEVGWGSAYANHYAGCGVN